MLEYCGQLRMPSVGNPYIILLDVSNEVFFFLAHNTPAALRHAATLPNLYNDVIFPRVLT